MLVDIFSTRYESRQIWNGFQDRDQRLLNQTYRILSEDLRPPFVDGKKSEGNEQFWGSLHDELSRELGLLELSTKYYWTTTNWNGNQKRTPHTYTNEMRCRNWYTQSAPKDDLYIKERLSLIELGFRKHEVSIAQEREAANKLSPEMQKFLERPGIRVPGDALAGQKAWQNLKEVRFQKAVEELNTRFEQAGKPLNYHSGFIQILTDELVQNEIETPFWQLVASEPWENVDIDMKEALDRRDGGGRDPAFYAARALESTIKVISEQKSWTTGKEAGAYNFIENLASRKHGFIEPWEGDSLKAFFTAIRNPMGHGPGSGEMPRLNQQQTEWAIEFSMSWIKSLINRLGSEEPLNG